MHDHIIGLYFFNEGITGTVNGERYRIKLNTLLAPVIEHLGNCTQLWFQQDEVTCHTSNASLLLLHEMVIENIISQRCILNHGHQDHQLSPPDFFLWGYLKERVYINK